ncbi:MAG: hypothetical protein Q9168_002648 [Polycauliona sp. 1 TL-2023]
MVNKPGKPKSKRTPVRLRHKIEKASAAKQRKTRKLAKKVTVAALLVPSTQLTLCRIRNGEVD